MADDSIYLSEKRNKIELKKLIEFCNRIIIKDEEIADSTETTESMRKSYKLIKAMLRTDTINDYTITKSDLLNLDTDEIKYSVIIDDLNNIPSEYKDYILEYKRFQVYQNYMTQGDLNPYYENLYKTYIKHSDIIIKDFNTFLNYYDLPFYVAGRLYNNFSIIWTPKDILSDYEVKIFKTCYNESLTYFMKVCYNKAYKSANKDYNNFCKVIIIFMAINRYLNKRIENIDDIDFFDEYSIRNLFLSYGLDYFFDMPLKYQKRILKNINYLIKNKGTNKAIINILNIFGFENIRVMKYFLAKEYKKDENGRIIYDNPELYFYGIDSSINKLEEGLKDPNTTKIDYDTFVKDDKYWQLTDEEKNELLEDSFNWVYTKYISVDSLMDLNKLGLNFAYLHNYLNYLDKMYKSDDLKIAYYDYAISENEIKLTDGIMCLYALIMKKYGYKDLIVKEPSSICKIYNFNFEDLLVDANNAVYKFIIGDYDENDCLDIIDEIITNNRKIGEFNINPIDFDVDDKNHPYKYDIYNGKSLRDYKIQYLNGTISKEFYKNLIDTFDPDNFLVGSENLLGEFINDKITIKELKLFYDNKINNLTDGLFNYLKKLYLSECIVDNEFDTFLNKYYYSDDKTMTYMVRKNNILFNEITKLYLNEEITKLQYDYYINKYDLTKFYNINNNLSVINYYADLLKNNVISSVTKLNDYIEFKDYNYNSDGNSLCKDHNNLPITNNMDIIYIKNNEIYCLNTLKFEPDYTYTGRYFENDNLVIITDTNDSNIETKFVTKKSLYSENIGFLEDIDGCIESIDTYPIIIRLPNNEIKTYYTYNLNSNTINIYKKDLIYKDNDNKKDIIDRLVKINFKKSNINDKEYSKLLEDYVIDDQELMYNLDLFFDPIRNPNHTILTDNRFRQIAQELGYDYIEAKFKYLSYKYLEEQYSYIKYTGNIDVNDINSYSFSNYFEYWSQYLPDYNFLYDFKNICKSCKDIAEYKNEFKEKFTLLPDNENNIEAMKNIKSWYKDIQAKYYISNSYINNICNEFSDETIDKNEFNEKILDLFNINDDIMFYYYTTNYKKDELTLDELIDKLKSNNIVIPKYKGLDSLIKLKIRFLNKEITKDDIMYSYDLDDNEWDIINKFYTEEIDENELFKSLLLTYLDYYDNLISQDDSIKFDCIYLNKDVYTTIYDNENTPNEIKYNYRMNLIKEFYPNVILNMYYTYNYLDEDFLEMSYDDMINELQWLDDGNQVIAEKLKEVLNIKQDYYKGLLNDFDYNTYLSNFDLDYRIKFYKDKFLLNNVIQEYKKDNMVNANFSLKMANTRLAKIFSENMNFRDKLIDKINNETKYREYRHLLNLYQCSFIGNFRHNMYKGYNSFTDYLKENSNGLYNFILKCEAAAEATPADKELVYNEYILQLCSSIDNYLDNDLLDFFIQGNTILNEYIKDFIYQLVDFIRAYTIQIRDINNILVFDEKFLNTFTVFDDGETALLNDLKFSELYNKTFTKNDMERYKDINNLDSEFYKYKIMWQYERNKEDLEFINERPEVDIFYPDEDKVQISSYLKFNKLNSDNEFRIREKIGIIKLLRFSNLINFEEAVHLLNELYEVEIANLSEHIKSIDNININEEEKKYYIDKVHILRNLLSSELCNLNDFMSINNSNKELEILDNKDINKIDSIYSPNEKIKFNIISKVNNNINNSDSFYNINDNVIIENSYKNITTKRNQDLDFDGALLIFKNNYIKIYDLSSIGLVDNVITLIDEDGNEYNLFEYKNQLLYVYGSKKIKYIRV